VEGNANALVQVTHRASLGTQEGTELLCWVLDTETLQLNISGGNIPQGVMIRESPTLPSPGGTSVARLSDGEFRISSFFDIFTEITVNGGQTWVPATGPARVTLICLAPESPHPTPNLPPPDGKYTSPAGFSVAFQSGVVIKDIRNRAFTESMPPPPAGQS
jgi:hypothetical protein